MDAARSLHFVFCFLEFCEILSEYIFFLLNEDYFIPFLTNLKLPNPFTELKFIALSTVYIFPKIVLETPIKKYSYF